MTATKNRQFILIARLKNGAEISAAITAPDTKTAWEYANTILSGEDIAARPPKKHAAPDAKTISPDVVLYPAIFADDDTPDADGILYGSQWIVKRTLKNAIMREGTPRQWYLYYAAQKGYFNPPTITGGGKIYLDDADDADALIYDADDIAANIDIDKGLLSCLYNDLQDLQQAAAVGILTCIKNGDKDIKTIYKAGFAAVNKYLSDLRAIRVKTTPPPLSFDTDISADIAAAPDADEMTPAEIDKEIKIRQAMRAAYNDLTPRRKHIWRLAAAGHSQAAISKKMRIDRRRVSAHFRIIRMTAAAALQADAPEIAADILTADYLTAAPITAKTAARNTAAALSDIAADILTAVDTLPPVMRKIFNGLIAGKDYRSIAAAVGVSKSTVARHAMQIRGIISAAIEDKSPKMAALIAAANIADIAAAVGSL